MIFALTVLARATRAQPLPGGGKLGPFQIGSVPPDAETEVLRRHRLDTVGQYNDRLKRMDYSELVTHAQIRREYTGESIDAQLPKGDLRDRMKLDPEDPSTEPEE